MSFLIDLFVGNLPWLIAGLGALFGLGVVYRKGRVHARAKSDKELKDALGKTKKIAKQARAAGKRVSTDKLRADDGHKRK